MVKWYNHISYFSCSKLQSETCNRLINYERIKDAGEQGLISFSVSPSTLNAIFFMEVNESGFEYQLAKQLQHEAGVNELKENGLNIEWYECSNIYTQFQLGKYGRPDIVRISLNLTEIIIEVFELKVVDFNISQLYQLCRYVSGIKRIVYETNTRCPVIIKGYLITGRVRNNDFIWLGGMLKEDIKIYETTGGVDKFLFKDCFSKYRYHDTNHDYRQYISSTDLKARFRSEFSWFAHIMKEYESQL